MFYAFADFLSLHTFLLLKTHCTFYQVWELESKLASAVDNDQAELHTAQTQELQRVEQHVAELEARNLALQNALTALTTSAKIEVQLQEARKTDLEQADAEHNRQRLAEVEAQLAARDSTVISLQSQLSAALTRLDEEHKAHNEELAALRSSSDEALASKQQQHEAAWQIQKRQLEEAAAQENAALQEQLAALTSQLETQRNTSLRASEEQKSEALQQVTDLQQQLRDLRAQLEEEKFRALTAAAEQHQAALTEAKAQLAAEHQQRYEAMLQQQQAHSALEIDGLRQELGECRQNQHTQAASFSRRQHGLENEIHRLSEALQGWETQCQQAIETHSRELLEMRQSLEEAYEAKLCRLEAALQAEQAVRRGSTAAADAVWQQMASLTSDLEVAQGEAKKLAAEVEQVGNLLLAKSQLCEKLEQQMRAFQAAHSECASQAEMQNVREQLVQAQTKLSQARQKLLAEQQLTRQLRISAEDQQRSLAETELLSASRLQALHEAKAQVESAEALVLRLEASYNEEQQRYKLLEEELDTLQTEFRRVRNDRDRARAEVQWASEAVNVAMLRADSGASACQQDSGREDRHAEELAQLRDQLKEVSGARDALQEELRALRAAEKTPTPIGSPAERHKPRPPSGRMSVGLEIVGFANSSKTESENSNRRSSEPEPRRASVVRPPPPRTTARLQSDVAEAVAILRQTLSATAAGRADDGTAPYASASLRMLCEAVSKALLQAQQQKK